MNNCNFKLKDIMDYLEDNQLLNAEDELIFKYNIFNEKIDTSFKQLSAQCGFTIETITDQFEDIGINLTARILRMLYTKYKNYELSFGTVGEFLSELFLRINKAFSTYKYKLNKIAQALKISDEELTTLRKTIYTNSSNNASVNADTDDYLNNIIGFVNNQTGGKQFDNRFNAYINYYRKIKNDTLLDFIESLKDLFIRVIPEIIYIYTEE